MKVIEKLIYSISFNKMIYINNISNILLFNLAFLMIKKMIESSLSRKHNRQLGLSNNLQIYDKFL